MSKEIILTRNDNIIELELPYSSETSQELHISSVMDEITIDAEHFPSFKKIAVGQNIALANENLRLIMRLNKFIVDMDDKALVSFDAITLAELDYGESTEFYSI